LGIVLALVGLALVAWGRVHATDISIDHAWARSAAAGFNSAVYLTIANNGAEADTLVGASCEAAMLTEIHQTRMDGGMMRMAPAGPIEIPAGGSVEFKPGGFHVMLVDLRQDLPEGSELPVTLRFERAGDVVVTAVVRPVGHQH
jgi:hypothetical protein